MKLKTLKYFLIAFILLLFSACVREKLKVVEVDFSGTNVDSSSLSAAGIAQPLRVVVSAMVSPDETYSIYQELLNYISKNANRQVSFELRKKYSEVNDLLISNNIDLAFICSGAYVKIRDHCDLLVVPVCNGKPLYQAYIIVNSSSSIKSFSDLKNKSFAFTDEISNTGRFYPARRIKEVFNMDENGVFSRTIFTHAHNLSIQMVNKNLVDAASVDGLIFEYMKKKTPEKVSNICIIEKSDYFGIPPVVVSKGIDPKLKSQLQQIFLNIHKNKDGKAILDKLMIDKFIIANDSLYNNIPIP